MAVLITTSIITAIGVFLAALLTVAELLCLITVFVKITINGDKIYQVKGGNHLLGSLQEQDIFIPSAWRKGKLWYYVKSKYWKEGGPLLPTETPYLTKEEIENNT